jgi:hypothetical protein
MPAVENYLFIPVDKRREPAYTYENSTVSSVCRREAFAVRFREK